VALLSAGELFGGVERHLLGMCTWLQRQDVVPLLVLFHDAELARQARAMGARCVIVPVSGALDPVAPRRLAEILAAEGTEVLHAHGYRAVVNGALARRRHRCALVRTVHGLPEPGGRRSPAGFKMKAYVELERFLGRRAGAAIAYVTDELRQRCALYDVGLVTRTIHNGMDPLDPAQYARPVELEAGRRHLGAIGRVSAVKGLQYAIEAMAQLDPGLGVVLNIIGTGPEVESLRNRAAGRGLGDRVRFLGFRSDVHAFMAHLDVLLMPSLHEGLPYTILEAMSLGVPIVASRVGGLRETLVDGESALLAPVGDVPALGAALARVLGDRNLADSLAAVARERQARQFDLDSMGGHYLEIYREAAATLGKET
jgi:glycosyltransferase involved in cell wall biosynthesis